MGYPCHALKPFSPLCPPLWCLGTDHGACKMGDTIFASREGTSPGPEHRQWIPLSPVVLTSHFRVVWGHLGPLALHPSLIPIEEMLASTFWAGEDIHCW